MKWILGIDLRPRSQGALAFARWLQEHGDTFVATHVVPEDHLRAALRYAHLDEVMAQAQGAADAVVAEAGAVDAVGPVHLARGVHVDAVLSEAMDREGADGVLVGRQAPREGRSLVHLGKVARRLLRRPPGPVLVVPPDLSVEAVGKGPVLVFSNLSEHAVGAARQAVALGKRWGRPVHLVHVIPTPQDWGSHYLPGAVLDELAAEHQRDGTAKLQAWVEAHGLDVDHQQVVDGSVLDEAPKLGRALDACVIVTGSRLLLTAERWLLTSVSSHVAAQADRPVLVVPPAGGE